jgi:P-type conjugative transfer protein TrbJ
MRVRLVAVALAAMLVLQQSVPARAGVLPFATEFTQILNYGQLVNQYLRQGSQLAEALKQTSDMVKNTQILTSQVFGPIMADINSLASVVQGGMALAYSMADLDAQFRSRFRGYAYNARTYFADYHDWSQTSLDTTQSTLRAAGLQSDQLLNEQTILANLRTMSETADGRMEALQVANQIAEQQVQQLMKLRALMLADLQSKQTYQAEQVQKDAATEAAVEQFFQYSRQASSGDTFQAGWK